MIGYAVDDVGEPGFGIEFVEARGLDKRVQDGGAATAFVRPREQVILAPERCTRLKCEGTYSSTMRSSAPIRPNFVSPQAGQTQGASCVTVSSGR